MALVDPAIGLDGGQTVPRTVAAAARASRRVHLSVIEWAAAIWLTLLILGAVLAPVLPLKDHLYQDFAHLREGPSWSHPFGTDASGRDLLARVVWGARPSLLLGLLSVAVGMVVGGAIGVAAGFIRGGFDRVVSIVVDAMLSIPGLVLLMAMTTIFGRNLVTLTFGLALLTLAPFIRLARAQSLTVSEQTFVSAARVLGTRRRRIVVIDVVPNVVPALAAYAVLLIGLVIVAEGALSFLGVGVPPPSPSWGAMIAAGRPDLETDPLIPFVPSAVMFISVLSIYVVGERLQKRFQFRESRL